MDSVYAIRLPAEVRTLLLYIRLYISLGIEGMPLACLGVHGYTQRLLLWMLLPMVAIGIVAIAVILFLRKMSLWRRDGIGLKTGDIAERRAYAP